MNFTHISTFDADNPERLARQLSALEDNVSKSLDQLELEAEQQALPASFTAVGSNTIVAIQAGQQLSVDTSQASAMVVFPPLVAKNIGKRFTLLKRVAANSVVCSCSDATVKRNAGAFPTITAAGATVFYCDSTGYFT
jgi:hypothetical protein